MKALLYRILRRDMIKKLSKKHGSQFINDVMKTFDLQEIDILGAQPNKRPKFPERPKPRKITNEG